MIEKNTIDYYDWSDIWRAAKEEKLIDSAEKFRDKRIEFGDFSNGQIFSVCLDKNTKDTFELWLINKLGPDFSIKDSW